jgi:hypothetical protein
MRTIGNYKFNHYTCKWERCIFSTFRWLLWLENHANHRLEVKRNWGPIPSYDGGLLD